jgi:hypothetical protein
LPGVKRPGRGVNHLLTSNAEVKEIVELYFYSPSGPSWQVIGRHVSSTFYSAGISNNQAGGIFNNHLSFDSSVFVSVPCAASFSQISLSSPKTP